MVSLQRLCNPFGVEKLSFEEPYRILANAILIRGDNFPYKTYTYLCPKDGLYIFHLRGIMYVLEMSAGDIVEIDSVVAFLGKDWAFSKGFEFLETFLHWIKISDDQNNKGGLR